MLTEIRTAKGSVEVDAVAVTAAREIADEASSHTRALSDKADEIESKVVAYEKKLGDLETEYNSQLKKINDLLPGATTTGLAYAFDDRRKTFLDPHKIWQIVFVGSVAVIVLLAFSGL